MRKNWRTAFQMKTAGKRKTINPEVGKSVMLLQKWKKDQSDWHTVSERKMVCPEEPAHAAPSVFVFLILWEAIEASWAEE